jgi:L-aspartate semialdehyde sulfurtransferase ferredoxin
VKKISRRLVLKFPRRLIDRPVISDVVHKYQLDFNILKAQISPRAEGLLVIELSTGKEILDSVIRELKGCGVIVESLAARVRRDDDRCLQCGVCTGLCPTGALSRDPESQYVSFDPEKCVACNLCMDACPAGAMQLDF